MKGGMDLGIVDTIYEEENYDYSSSSSSSSSLYSFQRNDLSSPSTPLRCRVKEWSLARDSKPDVFVHVMGASFHLHKDPLTKKSLYLKRRLTGVSEFTLSPPLNITVEAFTLVADFCYGAHVQLTPFNFASLRVAAELLLMTETDRDGRENLRQMTELYFLRAISVGVDYTRVVLRSCFALLPESETTAFLVGRCIEALVLTEDGEGVDGFLEDAVKLPAGDFAVVADAVQRRFHSHDLLYRIVDVYVQEQNGKVTEEEKVQICSSIDCGKLSPPLLLHAVQNPKMPLRFIVRAMLQEHLNTRRSVIAASAAAAGGRQRHVAAARNSSVTLGSLLRRESAAQQAARFRATMDSTSSRIKNLEKELSAMKKLISEESEKQRSESDRIGSRSVMDSGRSTSFHCVFPVSNDRIERGERGSVSSLSTTFRRGTGGDGEGAVAPSFCSAMPAGESPKAIKRSNGRSIKTLIKGLKSTFWSSKQSAKKINSRSDEIYDGLDDFVWIKEDGGDDCEDFHSRCVRNYQ